MVKVFLHHKADDKGDWINEERHFARLPCVGEYVALHASSLWYQVYAVVHCPFEGDFEAEVFLHKPDNMTNVITAGNPLSID